MSFYEKRNTLKINNYNYFYANGNYIKLFNLINSNASIKVIVFLFLMNIIHILFIVKMKI